MLRKAFGTKAFRAVDARQVGVTPAALKWAMSQGSIERVSRGVYRVSGSSGYLDRVRAAALRHPDAVASHGSAAALHGLACPWPGGWRQVELTGQWSRRFTGSLVHRHALAEAEIVVVDGIRCTSPARTVLDVAAAIPLHAALVVADSFCRLPNPTRMKALDPEFREELRQSLRDTATRLRYRRGIASARLVCELAEPAAESPAESWARGLVIEGRFPVPAVGIPVVGADGRTYFADLCWQEQRLIAEIDGAGKYNGREDLLREKNREDELRAAAWDFTRWPARDLWRDPAMVARKLTRHGLAAGQPQQLRR